MTLFRGPTRWLQIVSLPAALIAIGLMAVAAWGAGVQRHALWPVVQACAATYRLIGSPFPCLKVDLQGGEGRGFVVLRPPIGEPDTILSPIRHVTGVEDPFLQSPDAPNYFADAWDARSLLDSDGPIDPTRVALVVNPAIVRSQDQMHIHIACLVPEAATVLRVFAPRAPIGEWAKLGALIPHSVFWIYRTGQADLAGVYPFRLAAEGLAGMARSRADITIAVASVPMDGTDEFVVLATYVNAPHQWWPMGSDDLLEYSCGD